MGAAVRSQKVPPGLKDTSLYSRLKNSCVHDLYWRVSNREFIDARRKQVDFYRDLLEGFQRGDLIFDIGANVGEKTDVFVRLGARVVAVEPDEHNQEVLRGKFLRYRLRPKPVCIVGNAVSDKVSVETMWIDGPGSALNTLSRKWVDALRVDKDRFDRNVDALEFAEKRTVETTTIEHLTAQHGVPFFVKIDVEGHELSVLMGLRHPVPYLSFEVNLPEFKQEGLQCLGVLEALSPAGKFNYAADCSRGLLLEQWVDSQSLAHLITCSTERCIEVFWRSSSLSPGWASSPGGHGLKGADRRPLDEVK
jgi:FkbM family methyltransferase